MTGQLTTDTILRDLDAIAHVLNVRFLGGQASLGETMVRYGAALDIGMILQEQIPKPPGGP